MSRLRVRIELNRGGVGVPLDKLASVVQQAQSFFRMLGDDVHIDQSQGDWLGFDFDHESLNFTAEFVGAVTQDQVAAFHSAFDGTTPLRRATIAQFARIADAIEEDEVIGFGLYLNSGDDPAEWRCLSRRDALRITDEIQVLLGAAQVGQESHLPAAAADGSTSARYLFGKRDRAVEASKLTGAVREVEASLSKRISRLEGEVENHTGYIQDLRSKSYEAEMSMGRLLSAVEGFCEQAASRLETATTPALAAATAPRIEAPSQPEVLPKPEAAFKIEDPFKVQEPAKMETSSKPEALSKVPEAFSKVLEAPSKATESLPKVAEPQPKVEAPFKEIPFKVETRPLFEAPPKAAAATSSASGGTTTASPAPAPVSGASPMSPVATMLTAAAASPNKVAPPVMTAAPFKEKPPMNWWRSPAVILVGLGTAAILLAIMLWPSGSAPSASETVHSAPVTTSPTPAPKTATPVTVAKDSTPAKTAAPSPKASASAPAAAGSLRIELVASEPSWIAIRGSDGSTQMTGMVDPGKAQTVDIREPAVLRAGNAGGLTIRANGKLLGPLGPHGAVRDVEFKNGEFKLIPIQ